MFDCHYDLLTHILIKQNDINYIKNYCKRVYTKENIIGGIFNLFYMTEKEMKEEIGIAKINVIEDLKFTKKIIEENKLISDNIQYIFGIEGLDCLEKIEDLDILYELGLRSTNPVWNNPNKFGGGIKANKEYGLTILGEKLIKKLVRKQIAIDLSHANKKTFYDIIDICKKMKDDGYNPIVFASHSNCKAICDVTRNLEDNQILEIKKLGGIIGIVSIKPFCSKEKNSDYEEEYIKHINYLKELLGGVNNIAVATDDMRYYNNTEEYQNMNIYKHEEIASKLRNTLSKNGYSNEEINKILYKNFKNRILNRLKNNSM